MNLTRTSNRSGMPAIYGVVAAAEVDRLAPLSALGEGAQGKWKGHHTLWVAWHTLDAAQPKMNAASNVSVTDPLAPLHDLGIMSKHHPMRCTLSALFHPQHHMLGILTITCLPYTGEVGALELSAARMAQAAAELVARERELLDMVRQLT